MPTLFQKVSRLIASLILLSTVDGSFPPPLCSKESLSLSHWAAFIHQASICSIVNYQYLSFARDKTCSFKAGKGFVMHTMSKRFSDFNSKAYVHYKKHGGQMLARKKPYKEFIERSDDWIWLCIF